MVRPCNRPYNIPVRQGWAVRGKSSSSSNSNNLKVHCQSNSPPLCFTAPISSPSSSFICYYYGDEYRTIIIEIVYCTIIIKMNQIDTVAQCNVSSSSNSNNNIINTRHSNNTTRIAKVIVHNNQ